MTHNRRITLSVGTSRKATFWQAQTMMLSELYDRLRTPARGTEALSAYLAMPKGQQDDLKDVGGFMAGTLSGTRRKAGAVTGRDIITLDLDNITSGGTDDVIRRVVALGCGYCIYSTRKHMPSAPRLRVLLPLDRTCTADEYEPCARRAAELIGMELADPTTFEASRLMYWPSCSSDSQYVFQCEDKPMLSVDTLLGTYDDWRDYTSWPIVPGAVNPVRLAAKQGDPEKKPGIVGAFCRTYDIEAAIEAYLPGVYEAVDTMPGRYTFTGGTTTGGAVLYDNGKFLYSHHATDPCGTKLVNAFDLVRLHRFDTRDDDTVPGTPSNRLPSYTAMCELAAQDAKVSRLLLRERWEEATEGFEAVSSDSPEDDSWRELLKMNPKSGMPLPTIDNVWIILENDPRLRGKFAMNAFAGRGEVLAPLPWSESAQRRLWADNDNAGLYWYLEKYYNITGRANVDGALSLHSEKHAFNEVSAYLQGLHWDGSPRLDTLFIDYLGAEDSEYTRAVTRKAFTAAVARAMNPGCKYDNMTILTGRQGLGKSTLLDRMSKGWFNDSIRSFEGKEASELLQGVWIVEVGELDAFRRSDVSRIKQFLSQKADRFRAAYGRHVKEIPRRCVFFGTTNNADFLQDRTGNRRFWPVECGLQEASRSIWRDLDNEVDQLWAEAVARWRLGESLYLDGELAEQAQQKQEAHRETSTKEGLIADFLERKIPTDWASWNLDRRRVFWSGNHQGEVELVERDRVCALEIWCELFEGDKKDMHPMNTRELNSILDAMPDWKRTKSTLRFGYCGPQRGFLRDFGEP